MIVRDIATFLAIFRRRARSDRAPLMAFSEDTRVFRARLKSEPNTLERFCRPPGKQKAGPELV
jgi:hypothetical protein